MLIVYQKWGAGARG